MTLHDSRPEFNRYKTYAIYMYIVVTSAWQHTYTATITEYVLNCVDLTTPPQLRAGKDACPPQLEYLKHVDQLIVRQVRERIESKPKI